MIFIKKINLTILLCALVSLTVYSQKKDFLLFTPEKELKKNKKIVLISGDEEYRSEETLPMLAQILTYRHGFQTVVLFSIDPSDGTINPEVQNNIPGLHHLEDADLMIIATRFRQLPDTQMEWIDLYLKSGKPVMGLRTATHAFNYDEDSKSRYKHYSFDSKEGKWKGGFGRLVLGETWINHHGDHGNEGTRGFVNGLEKVKNNPILKGVQDVWGPTDVYGIKEDILGVDATILLYGQPTSGMEETADVNWKKTILPVAWIKPYKLPGGTSGKAFATTMGASMDFLSVDFRRMVINSALWLLDSSQLSDESTNVEFIKEYHPTMFGFGTHKKGMKPKDYE